MTQQAPKIPASLEAEEAVLGSLLLDQDAITKIIGKLSVEDFYTERHRLIFRAILDLVEKRMPVDFVTLTEELNRRGELQQIGGSVYLVELINRQATAAYVEYYADIVARMSLLRRLISTAEEIVRKAYSEADAQEALEYAERMIFQLGARHAAVVRPLADSLHEAIDLLDSIQSRQRGVMGIPTGFSVLDNVLGGMQRSDLLLLAARPSMGKTALALNLALNAARLKQRVLLFSLEMSGLQIAQRFLAMESGIPLQQLRLGQLSSDEWALVMEAAGALAALPIWVEDTPVISIAALNANARRFAAEHGVDMVIVDYLQLITGSRETRTYENRVAEVAAISRGLKQLARELNTPVLALSQLSRATETRQDHKPMLSDLRESGALEQDADVVMMLYREDVYNPNSARKNVVDVIIAKHRNGPTGTVSLYVDNNTLRFHTLEIKRSGSEPQRTFVQSALPDDVD